uniref:Uncharacterized protein n=1 Tax=Trypanosoma congolense (strain IL3000) TaxID=1068625 RepID=G0UQX8_TRYCI|nr:hypothetical protein, unlikely [Trypanosoma congolense IL3000]
MSCDRCSCSERCTSGEVGYVALGHGFKCASYCVPLSSPFRYALKTEKGSRGLQEEQEMNKKDAVDVLFICSRAGSNGHVDRFSAGVLQVYGVRVFGLAHRLYRSSGPLIPIPARQTLIRLHVSPKLWPYCSASPFPRSFSPLFDH